MPDKPTVTDEHLKKYEAIMGTQVKPASSSAPASPSTGNASSVSKLLSSIPKPKGIGNKIFIFTGKKKIIMDGSEREVEKIKTVDAGKEAKKQEEATKTATPPTSEKDAKPEVKKQETELKKTSEKKKFPRALIVFGVIIFVAVWAGIWAYLLGYFSL